MWGGKTKMKKKTLKTLALTLAVATAGAVPMACDNSKSNDDNSNQPINNEDNSNTNIPINPDQPVVQTLEVTFDLNQGEGNIPVQRVAEGLTAERPTNEPTKDGYAFDNWYDAEDNVFDFEHTRITNAITIYAHWKEIFQVTFNSFNDAGEATMNTVDVIDGNILTAEQKPSESRNGHNFGGWYTTEDFTEGTEFNLTTDAITANTILYAKWTKKTFTVTFDAQNGAATTSATVNWNETVSKPDNPTKTGYRFLEKWLDEDGNEFDFTTPITENITLHAAWIETHTVTFNKNNGDAAMIRIVDHESTVSRPNTPSWNGHEFVDWYTTADFARQFVFTTEITEDITLYAKWNVTVTFNVNGGSPVSAQSITYNTSLDSLLPSDPTRTGYTFGGWYTDLGLTQKFTAATVITEHKTVYAKWNANPCTVTFAIGENATMDGDLTQTAYYDGHATAPVNNPTKEGGYEFRGWYKNQDCTQEFSFDNEIIKGDTTIYAKWIKLHTVTFNNNGVENSTTVRDQETVTATTPNDREGYEFGGWYLGETEFNFDTPITDDITLQAKWDQIVLQTRGTLDQEAYFNIENGVLCGLTEAGKNYAAQYETLDVVIPDSVREIYGNPSAESCYDSYSAFVYCQNIEDYGYGLDFGEKIISITLNNNLTTIGVNAFHGCAITEINIPRSVTEIGTNAFYECPLTSIVIPENVTSIGYDAFYKCGNLMYYCEATEKPDGWDDDWNYSDCQVYWGDEWEYKNGVPTVNEFLYEPNDNGYTLTKCNGKGDVVIPSTYNGQPVTEIGYHAFNKNYDLTSVTIPDSVTSIGDYAFYEISVNSIIIPDSVTSVSSLAIDYISNDDVNIYCEATEQPADWNYDWLGDCVLGGQVYWGDEWEYDEHNVPRLVPFVIKNGALIKYQYNGTDTDITIPNTVTTINDAAFYATQDNNWLSGLRTITIPNSVTRIEGYTFSCGDNLEAIYVPSSVEYVGEGAFYNCINATIYIDLPEPAEDEVPEGWDTCWGYECPEVVWRE